MHFMAGLLAQETGGGFDFTVYGVAGTTIALLLYFLNTLWKDNRELRKENQELATTSLERITTVATTASAQLAESAKTMEAATVMMHQVSGRPSLSPRQLHDVEALLRELKAKR